jgi:CBS domain-containing protein
MNVCEVMTPHAITVSPSDSVANAIRLMLEKRISGLPVVDGQGNLVGMVTEGDLLRRSEIGTAMHHAHWLEFLLSPGRLAGEYAHAHGRRVDAVMTRDVVVTSEDTPLGDVVRLMEQHRIKRLPVMRDGKVIGIVSRANLLHALAALVDSGATAASSDTTIRGRILNEVALQPWGPSRTINVVVRDGNVNLWGTIYDERERQALQAIAENVPGVKQIHDHLICFEPLSGFVVSAPD